MARDATAMRSPHTTRVVLCLLQLEKCPGSKEHPAPHPPRPKVGQYMSKKQFQMNRISLPLPAPRSAPALPPSTPCGLRGSPGTSRSAKAPPPEAPLWPLRRRSLRNRKRSPRREGHPAESKLLVGSVTLRRWRRGSPFQLHPHDVGVGTGIKSQHPPLRPQSIQS